MVWLKENKAPAMNLNNNFHFKSYNKIELVSQDTCFRGKQVQGVDILGEKGR